jgi:hypothetical protein
MRRIFFKAYKIKSVLSEILACFVKDIKFLLAEEGYWKDISL